MEVVSGNQIIVSQISIKDDNILKEKFSYILKDLKDPKNAENIFSLISKPNKSQYDITNYIQKLSEATFYNFKKINLSYSESNTLIFCCSSVSPLNKKLSDHSFDSNSTFNSSIKQKKRNKKRENSNPCPMRIKFNFYENTKEYKICESSVFVHNHSSNCQNVKVN